jgi:molecular chaperone DnaK
MQASQKLGEMMYAKMQAEQGAAGAAADAAGGAGASEAKRPQEDDVVDADFKEVKRDA